MTHKASEIYYTSTIIEGVKLVPDLKMKKVENYLRANEGYFAGCKKGKEINSDYYHFAGCTIAVDECIRNGKVFSGGLSVFHEVEGHAKEVLGELEKVLLG